MGRSLSSILGLSQNMIEMGSKPTYRAICSSCGIIDYETIDAMTVTAQTQAKNRLTKRWEAYK